MAASTCRAISSLARPAWTGVNKSLLASDIIGPTFVAMIGQEMKILFFIILKLWNKILKTKDRIVFSC
jgi:hypothetical protein